MGLMGLVVVVTGLILFVMPFFMFRGTVKKTIEKTVENIAIEDDDNDSQDLEDIKSIIGMTKSYIRSASVLLIAGGLIMLVIYFVF